MSDRPLKVLLTDPHLAGGGQVRYLANLSRELTRLGHQVTIGCKRGSVLERHAAASHCAVRHFVYKGGLRPRAWLSDIRQTGRYLREQGPDILHVSGSQDHWVSALGNRLLGRPVCVVRTRHNTYPVADNLPNRVLNRAWTEYQIVVCNVVREELARHPAFDGARMESIHNGVDADAFQPHPELRAAARAEFGYTESDFVAGIAARLVPAKGHEYLFRAAASLRERRPELRVLVLGQGDLEAPLRRLAGELGLGGAVHFAGFREDMARCVHAFDVGVQPSVDCDTSSFSLKEQMACEIPVIASDYGGLTEIIDDGVEGLVVPAGTVEPLGAALDALAGSTGLRMEMGRRGRMRVLRDFTIEVFAARTVRAYRRAMEIHRTAGHG